jgi:hypothetical protein
MLSRRISVSKKLNNLPVKTQLIWIWTIPYLDDFGCYTADPEDIKAEALPKNKYIKVGDITRALRQAHDAGLIVLYEVDGKHYQKYVNFESFQTFRADRNRQHEYPDFDPKTAKVANGKPTTTSDSPKLVLSEVSVKRSKDKQYSAEFLSFWKQYPKRWIQSSGTWVKVGKWEAQEEWNNLAADEQAKALAVVKKVPAGRATKDAHRWLHHRRFDDYELPKPPAPPPEPEQPGEHRVVIKAELKGVPSAKQSAAEKEASRQRNINALGR